MEAVLLARIVSAPATWALTSLVNAAPVIPIVKVDFVHKLGPTTTTSSVPHYRVALAVTVKLPLVVHQVVAWQKISVSNGVASVTGTVVVLDVSSYFLLCDPLFFDLIRI